MSTLARVLLIGRDQGELETRAAVLEHFWRIRVAVVAAQEDVPMGAGADLVVVCETMPGGERQVWVDFVKRESPTTLVVKMNGHPAGPHAGADATVNEDDGPGALVSTIYELLTERGLGSRGWPLVGEAVRLIES